MDYKIISKALALCMKKIISKLIDQDQRGFIANQYTGDNIIELYSIIDKMEEEETDTLLVSINFYKAFDSFEWSYIEKILDYFQFPDFIKYWFTTLYNNLNTSIRINGNNTEEFPTSKGLQQGSPWSPLLFILGLEFFTRSIRSNTKIKGIPSHNGQSKQINLLADDTFLSIIAEDESLSQIIQTLSKFELISGLKANLQKSNITKIGPHKDNDTQLSTGTKFQWTSGVFSYLGAVMMPRTNKLSELNFPALYAIIKSKKFFYAYPECSGIG